MPESIGLVLAGGGARGAYEVGALSVLLPWPEQRHGQRPDVIVGTSVGALNAAYLAANAHEDGATLAENGCHEKTPLLRGFLQAAEGARTLDLLHGKQTL